MFLIDSSAGLGIGNQGGYLVNFNEYLLEKSKVVGRENNNHSAVDGIIMTIFSVSQPVGHG